MRERERLLWTILIILLLIILGYMSYSSYRIGRQVRAYQEALQQESMGSEDPQLKKTVEDLETDLRERLDYHFSVNRDPLDLTQVIHSQRYLSSLGFKELPESENKMRLSCTVVAEQSAAIIKFQGRSHVIRLGDTFNGYRLVEVQRQKAILERGGQRLVLITEKAPDTLDQERSRKAKEITASPDTTSATGNF